jgi:diguanylate cyclase (GGDEF)-like protein
VRKDGQQIHVSVTVSPIHDATGRVITISTITRDITERKRMEEALRHVSTHDGLTGLFNRTYFEAELDRLKRGREFPVSVVLVDVDDLKWVNDSQGHVAGDELLRRAAAVLQASFRAEDAIARIGGDEFGVLLPSADERVAGKLAQRVRHNLGLHNSRGEGERLSLSLGTATAAKRERLAEAIRRADERLYHDKSDHRQWRFGTGEYQSTASRGLRRNFPPSRDPFVSHLLASLDQQVE